MNVNQWAFSAVTGYEGPDAPRSAAVDGWQDMSADELRATIEAHIEHYAPAEFRAERAHVDAIIEATQRATECGTAHDWAHVYASLDRDEIAAQLLDGCPDDCRADHETIAAAIRRGDTWAEILSMPETDRWPDTYTWLSMQSCR